MSAEDDTTPEPEEVPAGADPEPGRPISVRAERGARMTPEEAVRDMRITLPARGNRALRDVVDRANHDTSLKALWHAANVNAVTRLQINDHSWVHIQIVTNIGLKLLRELRRAGVEPGLVTDHGLSELDAEVAIAAAALFHDTGMAIHRTDHEAYSLFLTADTLGGLLAAVYEEPERSVIVAEAMHAVISHRSRGAPFTLEGAIVRVADALDMAKGRSRIPFEAGQQNIHALSNYAIDEVRISAGEDKAVRVEVAMNNSAGIFQVDGLLKAKLRGSGLEPYVEVVAHIDTEAEKRLVPMYRLEI